ncbi:MAG TPA: zinc-ribbon domain containing protein [Planctomycetota bacterium]|nr:zinc-ribbon domain containing protein [Planctomycetota bacterium]
MPFTDKKLVCKDCNEEFVFSSGQQEHHAKLGLRNEPKRCMVCRQASRMRNEDRLLSGGGRRPPRPGFGGGDAPRFVPGAPPVAPREMFTVTCGQCGRPAEVPFKPRGDRPVLCRDCFRGARR